MEHDVLIEVEQLSRHYLTSTRLLGSGRLGKKTDNAHLIAVDNISFTLQRGQILGFLGPNGAGKSTTMRMLTGNLAPTQGRIEIAGIDLLDRPIEAKAKIGYLPDTPPLYKDLSVDEYLRYCAQLNRIAKKHIASALDTAKARCGLSEHGKRIIAHLSKGYQQRVGIAQAIIHSPDIVILDEPTVGLDPIQMVEIRKLIRELGESHSVMISSHILSEIQTLCSHVQIINQGRLVLNSAIDQFNQHMQQQTLRINCSQAVDHQALAKIDGVSDISRDEKSILIHCHFPDDDQQTLQTQLIDTAQQIISLASQQQWGLYEIYADQQSLEDIFMSLTNTDSLLNKEQAGD